MTKYEGKRVTNPFHFFKGLVIIGSKIMLAILRVVYDETAVRWVFKKISALIFFKLTQSKKN